MQFKFNRKSVEALLNHSIQSVEHAPCVDQLLLRELWKNEYKKTAENIEKEPEEDLEEDLDVEKIDTTKVPPGLWLIQEPKKGLYLTSNGNPLTPELQDSFEIDHETIPTKPAKLLIWEFIPAEHLTAVCTDINRENIQISVTPDSIAVAD